jgi:tRNA-splicing endonuclease subunit Sen15
MTRPDTMKPAVLLSPLQSLVTDPDVCSAATHLPSLHTLALQIQHNLQYQHAWTDLRVHTHSTVTNELLPRPLLTGLPPRRLYIHPDEQIELLKRADEARKGANGTLDVKAEPEREWILPTRLSEKWTLKRLSEVFGGITVVPPPEAGAHEQPANQWRTSKRVVLATVDSDSTVVYYIVHDGIVKPRQN